MASKDMDKLVSHAKTSGFVYQGSEIYDGLANTWDYGLLGVGYFYESAGMGSEWTCWWIL